MADAPSEAQIEHVEVAVPVPLRQTFTYAVPAALAGQLLPGLRVAVSFGRRNVAGFVLGPQGPPTALSKIKPVVAILDPRPVFDAELLGFLRAAAAYYVHPVGEVLRAAAPALPKEAIARLSAEGQLQQGSLGGTQLSTRKALFVMPLPAPSPLPRLGKKQQAVYALLQQRDEVSLDELRDHVRDPRAVVRALQDKGLCASETREVPADPFFSTPVELQPGPTPNRAQVAAIDALTGALAGGGGFLLHGVTGSGKTEVYLRLIEAARAQGKGALMLVPEIALTPQLVGRFRARFGDAIAVIHSELSDRARDDAWRALRDGRISIAIGARSALFAPVRQLGVVVVDEEHDASFKQEEGFRYHGRDMAILRAHRAGAVCVLGSATPALESLSLSRRGRLRYLRLEHRATAQPLPQVEIVDLNRHRKGPTQHRLLTGPLHAALGTCLSEHGQAILFLNRRGFSPALRCDDCGEIQQCPSCSVALTAHRAAGALRCHYCDFVTSPARGCSHCGKPLLELGLGTEQLEALVQAQFPQARVARLDRDTASGQGVEAVMAKLRRHEIDILVGTQMVTKGHDLPGVTLVGVVLADQSLAFPDFRAAERTFQLLAQVAGRAGRGEREGRVLLQTYQPEHPAVRRARTHDYDGFADEELLARQQLPFPYPPFGYLALVRVDATRESTAREVAVGLSRWIGQHGALRKREVQLLGPAPAPIARIRGRYRFRFLLGAHARGPLRAVLDALAGRIDAQSGGARVQIDVDPVNML